MPSETPRAPGPTAGTRRSQKVLDSTPGPEVKPPQSAEAILELFEIPKDTLERLSGFMAPGATLIVSDQAPVRKPASVPILSS
jgi:hypothetical protein